MRNTKQLMSNPTIICVLIWVLLGQVVMLVRGQTITPPNEPSPPEIMSVHPIGINGEPHLRPGKPVVVLGRNFSPILAKNRVSLRVMTDNPQTSPSSSDYVGEIHLTAASREQLEGVAPLAINDGYYLLWVRVENAGQSKAVKVWVGARSIPPLEIPIITAESNPVAPHLVR